ncbi:hypothetical protein Btru_018786 [Bulinus truncatus]|nr:hypothetical protein Btru_018786 [Bulinus truncatus]
MNVMSILSFLLCFKKFFFDQYKKYFYCTVMASSVSAPVVVPQATKRTHAEMSSSEVSNQQSPAKATSEAADANASSPDINGSESNSNLDSVHGKSNSSSVTKVNNNSTPNDSEAAKVTPCDSSTKVKKSDSSSSGKKTVTESVISEDKVKVEGASSENSSVVDGLTLQENKKDCDDTLSTTSTSTQATLTNNNEIVKSTIEPMETQLSTDKKETNKFQPETAQETPDNPETNIQASKQKLEDGEEPEKKARISPPSGSGKSTGKTPEQILEHMDKTFEQRRKTITKQMPTIPELKKLYPDLFMGKQLLIEFQRITKIDIDQKIQEFCVRYATAVIEMARNKKGAAPVLTRWETAKQENETLRQYWDMVTALCLLPLHFGENFVEMVLEIGEDEEVVAQGKIVPTLVARGNIFRTDEFFLIAENTIVQEFEEFTIAFASLYSSYWVFNMMYPETIENTYNYIQRCIVRQREPGSIPTVCKNFTKALQKWNKGKEGK